MVIGIKTSLTGNHIHILCYSESLVFHKALCIFLLFFPKEIKRMTQTILDWTLDFFFVSKENGSIL